MCQHHPSPNSRYHKYVQLIKNGSNRSSPLVRHQDIVDPSQLHIDFEAEVGQSLRRCLHHILNLDTLRGHAEEGVTHTLYLR